MAALDKLPNELLSLVSNHLERPKDIVNLALANRRLNHFTKLDGWKAFLKGRFGYAGLDADARNSVHGLTALYNNWNRKAFVARYLQPSEQPISLDTWQRTSWQRTTGQTMGYLSRIDSYEEILGAWSDRREVLAWSAGAQLFVRIKETGTKASHAWGNEQKHDEGSEKQCVFDQFRHRNQWYRYKMPDSMDGRDDITALKILQTHQRDDDCENVLMGTASGDLTLLRMNPTLNETEEWAYDTGERGVASMSISAAKNPQMAVVLGDSTLALYPIVKDYESEAPPSPLSEVSPIEASARTARIWTCSFISNNKVAVGLGPSQDPIRVYDITPSGFPPDPLRKFNLGARSLGGRGTVYPLLPLPSTSHGDTATSHLFLSGAYDGIVRLHDMRSPHSFETLFWDVTNDSSIYSLANQGLERFVVGSSMHSMLKVFDLRFPGSNAYHHIPVTAPVQPRREDRTYNAVVDRSRATQNPVTGGWNLFLNPRNPVPQGGTRNQRRRLWEDSPVYSLSIPSSTSPSIYAGLEGVVQNLTFLSVTDPHPDPLLAQGLVRVPETGAINIKSSYDPDGTVLCLGMYEQGSEQGIGMELLVQDAVRPEIATDEKRKAFARARGLDERWKDPKEDGERWVRGQQPPPANARGGDGRGRGRGRGRGARRRRSSGG